MYCPKMDTDADQRTDDVLAGWLNSLCSFIGLELIWVPGAWATALFMAGSNTETVKNCTLHTDSS